MKLIARICFAKAAKYKNAGNHLGNHCCNCNSLYVKMK